MNISIDEVMQIIMSVGKWLAVIFTVVGYFFLLVIMRREAHQKVIMPSEKDKQKILRKIRASGKK